MRKILEPQSSANAESLFIFKEGFGVGKKKNTDAAWAEAKKRCRLNQADIQMAKELGMTPKGLLKNIPAPNQQWKAPVNVWIRDLAESQCG